MRKVLFLLILIVLFSFSVVTAYQQDITNFKLKTSCSFDSCDAWIEVSGDPIPLGFDLQGNGTNEVTILIPVSRWDFTQNTTLLDALAVKVTTQSHYFSMGESPKIEKVIYNGMKVESGECHYVNDPDWTLRKIHLVCFDSNTQAKIVWNIGTEPYWYYLIETRINDIWDYLSSFVYNTLTNHEIRISALENKTTTTTIGTTTTTSSTTTTIGGCKTKYQKCSSNTECCNKVCNRNTGLCSL